MERFVRVVVLLLVLLTCFGAAVATAAESPSFRVLHERYQKVAEEFQKQLQAVADECERGSFHTDAARLRERSMPAGEQTLNIDDLPADVLPPIPPSLPELEQRWRVKATKLEQDYATDLYKLSRDAINLGHVSWAFQLVREVAFHDPDHRLARTLLGYKRVGDSWTTPFAATMSARNYVYHPTFGWLPRAHVERYEKGERNVNGRWVSADREAVLRSDFNYAWEVSTEHFLVKTNHSLEKGVQIGEDLEQFHKYFVREFAAFFNSPAQMRRLFDKGEAGSNPGNRFTVYYFRNKEDFVQHLVAEQSNVAISNGFYLPRKRIAYFFYSPDEEDVGMETLFHEVTHQLLSESSSKTLDVGVQRHYWLIEGIACYIESYRNRDGVVTIGDPRHARIYWARENLVTDNQYYEFETFSNLGMQQFQNAGDLPTLQKFYAQAAAMTHFYLNYDNGVYRDQLLAHLSDIYHPNDAVRARAKGMDELTGVPYETLQQQYRDYLITLTPEPVEANPGVE